jgi:hypothetical protein
MNRLASTLAYAGSVAAATLAAGLMARPALAETPTIDTTPFVSTRTRAEVRAEVMAARPQISAAGGEYALQQVAPQPHATALTREQVKAEFMAARDQVRAMHAEDSGSALLAQSRPRAGSTLFARRVQQD